MKLQLIFLTILLTTFSLSSLNGQYTIESNILLAPPYPTNLDAYIDYLEEGIIEVNNLKNEPQEVFFSGVFEETSGLISVNTNGILSESITMQPGINLFTPLDIESVFGGLTQDNLIINGLSQAEQNAILLNRQMPEGNYRICIQAFDELGIPISNPTQGCFDFDIYFAERPIILSPIEGELVDTLGFLLVNWDHVVNSPGISERLEYTLKIIDLTEEAIQNVELSMLDPAVPPAYEEELGNTYSANLQDDIDIFFEKGHQYAMRVTASDPDQSLGFQFGGHSEIVVFTYGELSINGENKLLAAPEIIDPEDEAEMELENPVTIAFDIEWDHDTDGVSGNLTYAAKMVDMSAEEIENISLSIMLDENTEFIWDDENFQKIIQIEADDDLELVKGNSYAIMVSVESDDPSDQFENDGHSEIITFVLGETDPSFTMPKITSPVAESYIQKPEIPLTWTHEVTDNDLKASLSYTLKIIDLTTEKIPNPTVSHFQDKKVNKMWDEAIVKKEKIIKPTGSQKLTLYHKYAMAIVAESSDEDFEIPNDGYSNIVSFTHGVEPADPDGCTGGDCLSILPKDLTSVAIKKLGLKKKVFKMGDLEMKIDELSGSQTTGYAGEGSIKVGFIGAGARIKVAFTELKVNAADEVVAGTANALYDDAFGKLDKLVSVGASTMLDIDFNAAKELVPALRSVGKMASDLSGVTAVSLPLGFDKKEGDETTVVGVTKMTFSPTKSEMMALFSLENPEWGKYVPSFGADNICFKNGGFANQVRLYLSKDYVIGDGDGDLILKKTDISNPESLGTFVELNCKGFKSAQITADIPVEREVLIPVDETGVVIEDESKKVMITISGKIERQSNWIIAASATPFEIPGLDGFSVTLKNGFYDSSDRSNPTNFALPDGYTPEENRPHWKGIWFEEISITAPQDWGGGSEDAGTKIAMKNFVKDKAGISIKGEATNILSIEKGSYEGFAISMDLLKIDILRNQFKSISLEGKMGLPILPEDRYLNYKGMVDHGDKINAQQNAASNNNQNEAKSSSAKASMVFTVNVGEESYYIPSIRSNLTFDETTQIVIKNDQKEKGIEALIEGSLAIGDTDGGPDLEPDESVFRFPALKFTGMSLSTIRPVAGNKKEANKSKKANSTLKLTPPKFEFAQNTPLPEKEDEKSTEENTDKKEEEEPKVNGFSIGLTEVSMAFGEDGESTEKEATDGMLMRLTVGGEIAIVRGQGGKKKKGTKPKKGAFELSAAGSLSIDSRINKKNGKFTFDYEKISAATLKLENAEMGPIKVSGELEIYNGDEDFGKGVVGDLNIEVPMLTVDVEARFGTMTEVSQEEFNYFYLFGKVDIEAGILIPQTPIKLHRFLGGAYSNMAMIPGAELAKNAKDKYIPDSDIAFGFKAGLGFSVTSPSAVFATMDFEMSLTDDGGINQITLGGQVDMMQEEPFGDLSGADFEGIRLKATASILPPRSGVEGRENLKINGKFLAKANLAEGTIVGAQAGTELYQVVEGNIDIDGEGFELILGSYKNPGVVKAKLGEDAGLDAKFYLQASYGKATDFDEAPVPEFIQRLLNQGASNEDQKDFISSGGDPTAKKANSHESTGMAMVAGLSLEAKADVAYSIIYANFQAMLGFDLSVKTSKNILCSNLGGSAKGMGADGYYAQGQVYAGLEGEVGLEVDIFNYEGKLRLAYVYAAMLLEGGFANPSWVKGSAAMGYDVLGGLLTGNTSFDIQIGEKCEAYSAEPFAGVKFIQGIDPDNGKKGVSPFVKPILSLENKLGRYSFKNQHGAMQYFDVRLEEFKIKGKSFGKTIASDQLSAHINVTKLEPNKDYEIYAKIKVYKWNGYNWLPAKSNGNEVVEEKTLRFQTGKMPNYVPWENVEDCYPFRNEKYYMKDDNVYNEGLIQLIGSQKELFEKFTPSGQLWHSKVQASFFDHKTSQWIYNTDVEYHNGSNVVRFKMPTSQLKTNQGYTIRMKRVWYKNTSYDQSVKELSDKKVSTYDNSSSYSSYTYKKEGKSYANASETKPQDIKLYDNYFSTSVFKKFEDKVTGFNSRATPQNNYTFLRFEMNNGEGFSTEEIGFKYIAESKSLNRNSVFVREDLSRFAAAATIDSYYKIKKRLDEVMPLGFNMHIVDNHKFHNKNWRKGFDFYDLPSRALYSNESGSSIKYVSSAYTVALVEQDIIEYDYMIYHLVESGFNNWYKDNYKSEYENLRERWYGHDFNASYGGWFDDWNSLEDKEVKHRVSYYFNKVMDKMKAEKEYHTTYVYTVPLFAYGKIHNHVASNTYVKAKKN